MDPNLTKEDIIILIIMIGIVYSILHQMQKHFRAYIQAQSDLYKWGLTQKLTDSQQKYLLALWSAYKNKQLPNEQVDELLSEEALSNIINICSGNNLPDNIRKYLKPYKTDKIKRKLLSIGFKDDHATIITGLLFYKIGGIHAIKNVRYLP